MITDQDVTKLKKTFVTKIELAKAIQPLATKKELTALEKKVDGLVYEVGDLKVNFAELREDLVSFVESMHVKMDRFLEKMDRLDLESKVCSVVQQRHTEQIGMLGAHAGVTLPS